MKPRAPVLLAALALAPGCTVQAPPRTEPQLHAAPPAAWVAAHAGGPVATAWWGSFGDATLPALVDEAIAQNHDLAAAAARLDAAAAQARIAGADRLPGLDLGFDAQRRRQNFIGLPLPGTGGGVLTRTFDTFGVNLTSSWELDVWGRIRAGERAAYADLAARLEETRAAHQSLAAQTARAYFAVVEARLQVTLAEQSASSFAATLSQVRDRFERGTRSALDVRLAENNVAATEALRENRREQLARARRQLELLLGRYPRGEVDAAGDLPAAPAQVPAGLPSELLQRRPDVVAAERRLAAQDQRVAEAVASLYPRIALTATAGTSSAELNDVLDPDFFVWSLLGNATLPLFHHGRLQNQVKLEEARSRELVAAYAGAALRAFLEVETALAVDGHLAEREQHLARAASAAEAASTQSEQRYRDGLEVLVTVLEAQRRALESRSQHITVRRLRLDNRIDLHLALGGGFAAEAVQP